MANFKFVKSATAAVLGASVLTTAVVVPGADASAKTTYKVNKYGYLVNAKTNKKVNGYKTYKGKLYKNGKKFTGKTSYGTYYVKGKKFTGKTKYGYYYVNGKRFTGTTKYGYYYVNGKRFNGKTKYGNLYVNGKRYTGTTKYGYTYYNGKRVEGEYKGKVYANGKKYTGVYKDKLYKNGVLNVGLYLHNGKLYEDAGLNEGKDLYKEVLYDGATPNKGLALYEGKLYNDSALATGYVTFDEKLYNDGALFTGEKDGVEYKDGVVVKYEVTSVKAINASELKVTFSAPVDAESATLLSNYELKVNDSTVTPVNAQISADKTTVTLLLNENDAFKAGDKYVIQTTNDIKNTNGKKLEKFVSGEQVFGESAAPTLVSVSNASTNLVLTFDRPVSSKAASDITLAKIDGVAVTAKDLKPVNPTTVGGDILGKAGSYSYTLAIQAGLQNDAAKVGTHDVVIYDVNDTTAAYPSKASVLKGSYTISNEAGIPEVKDTYAVNANRFFVETSQAVKLTSASKVTVTKGTHEFTNVDTAYDDALSVSATKVDATPGTYYDANGKTITGVWVVVSDEAAAGEENPLYKNGETSATLNVTLENYVAAVGNKVGAKTTKSVTLNKNNTKPSINKEKNVFATNKLTVQFNNNLASLTNNAVVPTFATGDVVVRDKDGVIVEGTSATATGDKVEITPAIGKSFDAAKAPYSVEFKKETFRNQENTTSVKAYLVNTLKNDELTTTVGTKSVNFEYAQFALTTNESAGVAAGNGTVDNAGDYAVDSTNNTITFKYAVEMDDSARNVANYTLDGEALPAGSKADFVGDKQTVRITLPDGALSKSTSYKFGIKSTVTTKEGSKIVSSLQTKAPVEVVLGLRDTVSPELAAAGKYLVNVETVKPDTTTKQIEVTFNEAIKINDGTVTNAGTDATNDFKVVINGSEQKVVSVDPVTSGEDKDKKLVITLQSAVNVNQAATITVVGDDAQTGDKAIAVLDAANNKLKAGSSTTISAYKYSNSNVAFTDAEAANADKDAIAATGTINADGPVTLDATGTNGSTITWAEKTDASNVASLSGNTVTFTRDTTDDADDTVVLTANITKGATTVTKDVTYTVKEAKAPTAPTATLTSNTIVLAGEAGATIKYLVGAAAATQADVLATGTTYTTALADTAVSDGQHVTIVVTDAAGNSTLADYVVTEAVAGTITAVTAQ